MVEDYPIDTDDGLYADFVLKNSAYHVTETADLRVLESHVGRETPKGQPRGNQAGQGQRGLRKKPRVSWSTRLQKTRSISRFVFYRTMPTRYFD